MIDASPAGRIRARARRAAWRANGVAFVAWSLRSLLGFSALLFALVVVLVALHRFWPGSPVAPGRLRHMALCLAALVPGEALLVAATLCVSRRVRPFQAAVEADLRLDLADRFASALALADRLSDPMVAGLVEDADRATETLDLAGLHPVPSFARAAGAAALVGAALLLVHLPGIAPPDGEAEEVASASRPRRSRPPGPKRPPRAESGLPGDPAAVGEDAETEPAVEPAPVDLGVEGTGSAPDASEPAEEPDPAQDEPQDNPGERPGDKLFGEEDRLELPRERIDIPSLVGPGRAVTREALVRETTPGEAGVPGPGRSALTPEIYQEFRRTAEAEIRSPRRTESDRELVRRYFDRLKP